MKLNLIAYPLVALVSLAAAGSALAEGPVYEDTKPFVSTKTRAEVKAEAVQARAAGTLRNDIENYAAHGALPSADAVPAALPRLAQRPKPAAQPRLADQAAVFSGEDSGSFALSRQLQGQIAQPTFATAE